VVLNTRRTLDHDGYLDIFTSHGHYFRGNGDGFDHQEPQRFGVYSWGDRPRRIDRR
jgi:hypothetical protein